MVAPQQDFDWESFSGPESQMQEQIPQQQNKQDLIEESPQTEDFNWENYDSPETYQGPPDPTAEESTLGYFARNIAANASRIGEQVFGRYGNMEKVGKSILSDLPEIGGILGWALSELVGPKKWEQMVKGTPGQQQLLPTSEQFKEASQRITQGYTKPKTKGEEKFQGYTEDIGATLSGRRLAGGQLPTLRQAATNNLGIPIAANGVKDIVEGLGFGKDVATVSKLGAWTALSLLGNVNAPNYASDLMNQGRNGIPNNVQSNVPRFQAALQHAANDPHLLYSDPRTALAREQLAAISKDLANGQTSTRSLMTMYDGINAAKRNRDLFAFNSNDRNFARAAIDRVRNVVRDEVIASGAAHPEALNNWTSGIQAWAVIHQSRAITNWIEDLARGPYAKILSGPAAALFGVGSFAGYKAPIVAIPASVGIPAAYKAGQTAYRVWNDPNLSRYYWHAVSAAQRENLPAFINNYNKLNDGIEKSDSAKVKSKSKK